MKAETDLHIHAKELKSQTELKHLLKDEQRNSSMIVELPGLAFDYSRQFMTAKTQQLLMNLAKEKRLMEKIQMMASGAHINVTEDRAVMHMALRARATIPSSSDAETLLPDGPAPSADAFTVDGVNVVTDVLNVQESIRVFAERVRSGQIRGATGKPLDTVLCVGIGGSFLGAKFVYEALRCDATGGAAQACAGRQLRFLANVDPVDAARALEGADPERMLVVVCSKTFTTAETMLNARTVREWMLRALVAKGATEQAIVANHFAACSTNVPACEAFGLRGERVFPFWDWVGGRYSVTSAVGLLPLALHFGWPQVQAFLAGARDMDRHFLTAPFERNLPVLLGLIGVWNSQYLGHPARALACYSEALCDFAAHVQQVDMESNGKRVTADGRLVYATDATGAVVRDETGAPVPLSYGEVDFGQSGTNSQHSFFQLFHQGRVVPVDFIGSVRSQHDRHAHEDPLLSNHDELMCNFFAQPDALALGRSAAELAGAGKLAVHREMPGNRPSLVLLFDRLSAYEVGVLLALYEHRTAVQGFLWDLNSFDQFGVELGKVLAGNVRSVMAAHRRATEAPQEAKLPTGTRRLLSRFLNKRSQSKL